MDGWAGQAINQTQTNHLTANENCGNDDRDDGRYKGMMVCETHKKKHTMLQWYKTPISYPNLGTQIDVQPILIRHDKYQ
jgi:hypothetical protein